MASFSYVVDTDPMARSLDGVMTEVEGTTVAVVGMQAAVIAAEAEAADAICDNVNRGFHTQILSQISQKRAVAKSEMDAKLIEMSYLRVKLGKIEEQFRGDFHRISERYSRFFRALDEMLKARIGELDRDSVRLGTVELRGIQGRNLVAGSQVPVLQSEVMPSMQLLTNAQVKLHSVSAIDSMAHVIERTSELKKRAAKAMSSGRVEGRVTLAIPVVIVETDDMSLRERVSEVVTPDQAPGAFSGGAQRSAAAAVQASKKDFAWSPPGAELVEAVRSRCLKLLAEGGASEREKAMFGELLGGSAWTTVG